MKKLIVQIIGISIMISSYACNNYRNIDLNNVTQNDSLDNLYQSGDYYLAGQPTAEMLEFLKTEGVTTIINLRSEKEITKVEETGFNEKEFAENLEFEYIHIPVAGYDAYNPETLSQFANVLTNNSGKVLVHCAGAVRAMYLLMAYLIKYENKPINEVVEFGKQIKFSQPLEGLLGEDIKLCMDK